MLLSVLFLISDATDDLYKDEKVKAIEMTGPTLGVKPATKAISSAESLYVILLAYLAPLVLVK